MAADLAEQEAEAKARTPWPATPKMSRADFNYLARVLTELDVADPSDEVKRGPGSRHQYIVEHFAYHLADTCARFDRARFVAAATR